MALIGPTDFMTNGDLIIACTYYGSGPSQDKLYSTTIYRKLPDGRRIELQAIPAPRARIYGPAANSP